MNDKRCKTFHVEKIRNGEIEFWRAVFCIIIFVFHVSLDSNSSHTLFQKGQIGVEVFFLLSGLFMARSADTRDKVKSMGKLGLESMKYVVHKYICFFPYHVFAFAGGFAICIYKNHYDLQGVFTKILFAVPQFFLIHLGGLIFEHKIVSVEWYLSSMLIAMLFLYPLLRRFYHTYVYICGPLLALSILGYAHTQRGHLLGAYDWCQIATWGVLRAVSVMSLGCMSYELAKYIKRKQYCGIKRFLLSLAGLSGYLFTILFANSNMDERIRFSLVFLLMVSVAVSYSGENLYGKYLDHSFCRYIGKLSLPFYLNTNIVRAVIGRIGPNMRYRYFILTAILINTALSALLVWIHDKYFVHKKCE